MMLSLVFGHEGDAGRCASDSTEIVGSGPASRVCNEESLSPSEPWPVRWVGGRASTCAFSVGMIDSSWRCRSRVRFWTVASAKAFASSWARLAVGPLAVTATTLLCATGTALT